MINLTRKFRDPGSRLGGLGTTMTGQTAKSVRRQQEDGWGGFGSPLATYRIPMTTRSEMMRREIYR